MLRKRQGELLKSDHDLTYVSFLPHDLVTGGIPHTGSRHGGLFTTEPPGKPLYPLPDCYG